MSLIVFDGFDYQTTKADSLGGSAFVAGRFGGYARMHDGQAASTIYNIPVADQTDEIFVGVAQYPALLSQNPISNVNNKNIGLFAGGVGHLTINFGSDGIIYVRRGRGDDTIIGQSESIVQNATWGYIEVRAVLHNSAGLVQVRYNGVMVIDEQNVDTILSGTPTAWDAVQLRMTANSSSQGDVWSDDLYILNNVDATATQGRPNNDFLGDVKVTTLVPDSDGTPSQWTPSTGADSYAVVDDAYPPNETDWIADDTPGNVDMMGITLPDTDHIVYGVQVESLASKDDAGAVAYRHRIASGAAVSVGDDIGPPAASFATAWDKFYVDPDGEAWLPSTVDALLVGVETRSA